MTILRRLLQSLLTFIVTFTIAFSVLYVLPGDPALVIFSGSSPGMAPTPEQLASIREQHGLDRPVIVQYFDYIFHALQGDLGASYINGTPVTTTLSNALPQSLQVAGLALLFAASLGFALGIASRYIHVPVIPSVLDGLPSLFVSLPSFWVGLLLIQIVALRLEWLPAFGSDGFQSLILPAITLAIPAGGLIAQVLSKSLEEAYAAPYVRVVAAKGASRRRIYFSHALRNAMIPTVTVMGVIAAELMALTSVMEVVFSRYGVGFVLAHSVTQKDLPVILGITIVIVIVFILANLIVDTLYPLLDPRTRSVRRRSSSLAEGDQS